MPSARGRSKAPADAPAVSTEPPPPPAALRSEASLASSAGALTLKRSASSSSQRSRRTLDFPHPSPSGKRTPRVTRARERESSITSSGSGRESPSRSSLMAPDFQRDGELSMKRTNRGAKWQMYVEEQKREGKTVVEPVIFVKIKIYNLGRIDLVKSMSFDIDFSIMTDWIDPSVIGEDRPDPEYEHFSPCVVINNCAETDPSLVPGGDARCRLQKKENDIEPEPGHVKRTTRYKTRIDMTGVDENLVNFPFDSHQLQIKLKADHCVLNSYNEAHGNLSMDDRTKRNPRLKFDKCDHEKRDEARQEWQIMGFEKDQYAHIGAHKGKDGRKDEIIISFTIRRKAGFFSKIFTPVYMCLALSASSFFLKGDDLNGRLSITATILVAFVGFQNLQTQLPYSTLLDKFHAFILYILVGQGIVHVSICLVPRTHEEIKNVFFKCNATNATNDVIEGEGDTYTQPLHETKAMERSSLLFLFLFYATVACLGTWNRVKREEKTFKQNSLLFRQLWDQIFYQLKIVSKNTILSAPWFLCVLLLVALSLSWSPQRCLTASLEVTAATGLCLTRRCSGSTNPFICRENVMTIFQLFFSSTSLMWGMWGMIFYVHLMLIADVTMLMCPEIFSKKKKSH